MLRRGLVAIAVLGLVGCEPRIVYVTREVPAPSRAEPTEYECRRYVAIEEDKCAAEIEAVRPRTCGQTALYVVQLKAEGKGDNHPKLIAARDALSRCDNATPTVADCADLFRRRDELEAEGKMPNHPDMQIVDAQIAICPERATN
jgi:hypothetical protein